MKRQNVQLLHRAGHTVEDVAELTGVSASTVKRVNQEVWAEGTRMDEASERKRRRIGRPSKVEAFRVQATALVLEKDSTGRPLQAKEIVRRLIATGYEGRKSAMYALLASLRPTEVTPVTRFEGLPGEFCQHDFGQVDVRFKNGETKRIRFFASRLKYSRYICVSLVNNEQTETVVRSVVEHYEQMGGVPLLGVFDRPTTIVKSWKKDGTATAWNPIFAGVMFELGVGVELCWPASGNQKGSVENLVGWVKSSFFKQRVFLDEDDLRLQLQAWQHESNTQTKSRATGEFPEKRRQEELPRLRPLKVRPEELALRIPVVAGPSGHVTYQEHEYLVPPQAIGLSGTLYLYRDRVRIVIGQHSVAYPRPPQGAPKQKLELPYLQAQMVAAAAGRRGPLYLMRQQLLDGGQPALDFLTELVHRRPRFWQHEIPPLHQALLEYGKESLLIGFKEALAANMIEVPYVIKRSQLAAQARAGKSDTPKGVAPDLAPTSQPGDTTSRRAGGQP